MIQRNGKIPHTFRLEELILLKWLYYPKQSADLMWSLSKHPFFTQLEEIILKFIWNHKYPELPKQSSGEKKKSWKHNPLWLQARLQSHSNQNSMIMAQKQIYTSMEQNSPEINPHTWGQLVYNKGDKNIQWRKTDSSASGVGKAGQPPLNQWN